MAMASRALPGSQVTDRRKRPRRVFSTSSISSIARTFSAPDVPAGSRRCRVPSAVRLRSP